MHFAESSMRMTNITVLVREICLAPKNGRRDQKNSSSQLPPKTWHWQPKNKCPVASWLISLPNSEPSKSRNVEFFK